MISSDKGFLLRLLAHKTYMLFMLSLSPVPFILFWVLKWSSTPHSHFHQACLLFTFTAKKDAFPWWIVHSSGLQFLSYSSTHFWWQRHKWSEEGGLSLMASIKTNCSCFGQCFRKIRPTKGLFFSRVESWETSQITLFSFSNKSQNLKPEVVICLHLLSGLFRASPTMRNLTIPRTTKLKEFTGL